MSNTVETFTRKNDTLVHFTTDKNRAEVIAATLGFVGAKPNVSIHVSADMPGHDVIVPASEEHLVKAAGFAIKEARELPSSKKTFNPSATTVERVANKQLGERDVSHY